MSHRIILSQIIRITLQKAILLSTKIRRTVSKFLSTAKKYFISMPTTKKILIYSKRDTEEVTITITFPKISPTTKKSSVRATIPWDNLYSLMKLTKLVWIIKLLYPLSLPENSNLTRLRISSEDRITIQKGFRARSPRASRWACTIISWILKIWWKIKNLVHREKGALRILVRSHTACITINLIQESLKKNFFRLRTLKRWKK